MNRLLPLLAGVLAAVAQSGAAQQTQADCEQSLSTLRAYFGIPVDPSHVVTVADGWCVLSDLALVSRSAYDPVITIDSLTWQSTGGFDFADRSLQFPSHLAIKVEGLRIGLSVGDPVMDYLMAVQRKQAAINASVDMSWDVATRELSVHQLSIDVQGDNAVEADAVVRNIDMSSLSALQASMFGASLARLSLTVQTNGLFEQYLLLPVGQFLLDGSDDPAAEVDALKKSVGAFVDTIPDLVLDASGRAALSALIRDMPNPAGTVSLTVASESGLGMNNLAPVVISGVEGALDNLDVVLADVDLTFAYQPNP